MAARAFWHGARLLAAGLALFLALLAVPAGLGRRSGAALRWLALLGLAAGLVMLGVAGGSLHGGSAGVLLGGALAAGPRIAGGGERRVRRGRAWPSCSRRCPMVAWCAASGWPAPCWSA